MMEVGNFDVGNSRKISAKFQGPYFITEITTPLTYKIKALNQNSGEFSVLVRRLRPFADRDIRLELPTIPLFHQPTSDIHLDTSDLPNDTEDNGINSTTVDYDFPDSVPPDQSSESIKTTGYRTKYGRISLPPKRH